MKAFFISQRGLDRESNSLTEFSKISRERLPSIFCINLRPFKSIQSMPCFQNSELNERLSSTKGNPDCVNPEREMYRAVDASGELFDQKCGKYENSTLQGLLRERSARRKELRGIGEHSRNFENGKCIRRNTKTLEHFRERSYTKIARLSLLGEPE